MVKLINLHECMQKVGFFGRPCSGHKIVRKKEMLGATITDNDRIGPSLAVMCSIERKSSFENFYDCRNPYFNMLSIFFIPARN